MRILLLAVGGLIGLTMGILLLFAGVGAGGGGLATAAACEHIAGQVRELPSDEAAVATSIVLATAQTAGEDPTVETGVLAAAIVDQSLRPTGPVASALPSHSGTTGQPENGGPQTLFWASPTGTSVLDQLHGPTASPTPVLPIPQASPAPSSPGLDTLTEDEIVNADQAATWAQNLAGQLIAIPGWRDLPLAQAVAQADGHPDLAPAYAAAIPTAQAILAEITTNLTNSDCGSAGGPSGSLQPAPGGGLPAGYQIPSSTPPGHRAVVAYALAQLGKAYVWGAAGPDAFDCSGLTMQAWAQAGVTLTHYTVTQMNQTVQVSTAQMVPGDLVFIPGSDPPGPGLPGHVGIYIGDDLVLSAADHIRGVIVETWDAFTAGGLIAVTDPAPGA